MQNPFIHLRALIFPFIGGLLGYLSWCFLESPVLLPLAFVILPLWFYSPSRLIAYSTILAYSLIAYIGVPDASNNYLNSQMGWVYWFAACSVSSFPYLLHFKNKIYRSFGLLSALILTAIPPFGIIFWSHPFSTVGIFWPDGGFIALMLLMVLIPLLIRYWPLFFIPCLLSILLFPFTKNTISNWESINTDFGKLDNLFNTFERQNRIMNKLNRIDTKDVDLIVLPETIAGMWLSGNKALWDNLYTKNTPVLFGAITSNGNKLSNSVILYNAGNYEVVYKQRQPIPIAMWLPFNLGSYTSHILDSNQSSQMILNKRVAFLMCYEQYLVYPILLSALDRPDYLIGMSNVWMTKGTNNTLRRRQKHLVISWSRLFNLPYLYSENI